MNWILAPALEKLREQINAKFPTRSKTSDGTIGDENHQSRTSDHNPWIHSTDLEGRDVYVVSALDLTNDPASGMTSQRLADALKAVGDPRIKYIISNKKIWNPSISPEWRPYDGKNPHDHHIHISVKSDKASWSSRNNWDLSKFDSTPDDKAEPPRNWPFLKLGSEGSEVEKLRGILIEALQNEHNFGPLLKGLVQGFQGSNSLDPDGKVGTYTWEKLKQKGLVK